MNNNPVTIKGPALQKALKTSIIDGVFAQITGTLTGGVFLVDFALKLGASNFIIGLIATIPFLAQLIQVAGVYLIEKFKVRKPLAVGTALVNRVLWVFMALIPFLFEGTPGLVVFLIVFVFLNLSIALSAGSWTSWMRDLVPSDIRGRFFSRRMAITTSVSIPLSLAAGYFIDWFRKSVPADPLLAYSILIILGAITGFIGIYFLSRIPEPRMVSKGTPEKLLEMLKRPFSNENFRNLMIFLTSWSFAVNLAAPFFTVYMLLRLELSMSMVIIFSLISQVFNVLFLPIWGKYSDHFGNKTILLVCAPLFLFSILAWIFLTLPERHLLTLPLLAAIHVFTGISTAGISLAASNIGLKLAPKGEATSYLTANSIVTSIGSGLAPIIGGAFADFFKTHTLTINITWTSPSDSIVLQTLVLRQWDFFFILAFLLGLYSLHRLSLVKEEGEVEEKVLIQSMMRQFRRSMTNLSTVDGLTDLVMWPVNVIKKTYRQLK